ncbi:DUF3450 domain-containing protein [Solimonas sp. K1W22B-7]|uniref:DUF3450 domain-containing protein n=1 Tax=Solimonas sp. K1W22B-7 TaxID=2303331 RepID=UPI000E32F8FE|nr:DUF3450 domain-containing protein [Solimonas sp. K1W22B-7]AXQ30708.1 DUF3450 domain-containing protein [Solimonas sp. K1W22B-7]
MYVFKTAKRVARVAIPLAVTFFVVAASAATVKDVTATGNQWLVAQVESQKRVDAMADEGRDIADQYRTTLRESEGLKLYLQQLRAQLKSQEEEMEAIRQESAELDRTNIEIQPLMVRMLDSLEQFVALDVPFLKQERAGRVEKLKEMMPRADVTVSEKYRRIVEAYQIEMEYGRTIEAYKGKLADKEVDFLRVGRVGLFYQTPDGAETGYWDRDKKDWTADDDYTEGVKEGLKVAKKQTSPNLLIVPIQAAASK